MFDKENLKIPLDKFIYNALYHSKDGYYMKKNPFGKSGDFITAPNISKIYSEMIFLWILSYWNKFFKDEKINVVELGAGDGEMMSHIIKSARKFGNFYVNCNFQIYERSYKLIKIQKEKLKKNKIKWIKNLDKLENKPTIFIGNEFLDALPFKQFIYLKKKWYEIYIQKKSGHYNFTNIKCDIKKIENKLGFKIQTKQDFLEISFEEIKIIKKLNSFINLNGGCMLFIDYAYSNLKMFDTLQAVQKHKKINIFKAVGKSDISRLINIPFIKKIAKKLNLELDYSTQRKFLLNMGIMQRAEILASKKSFLEKANIFYRVKRLIDKKQMGELFKVMYFYKKNKKFNLGFK